jgi:YidC/Oxa1 family membrane protein insertase
MDRNQVIGILLIMATFMIWTIVSAPSKEELEKSKKTQDSIALADQGRLNPPKEMTPVRDSASQQASPNDSVSLQQLNAAFGGFAPSSTGAEELSVLENELVRITFSNKGGIIREILLKKHYKTITDSAGNESKVLVTMLSSPENRFSYDLPVVGAAQGIVKTQDLYFQTTKDNTSITFRAPAGQDGYFEQKYTLAADDYSLTYAIATKGLENVLTPQTKEIKLYWENHLQKYERGEQYEQNNSTVYFKEKEEVRDYCSCTSDDTKELKERPIQWVAHANQFFNTSVIPVNAAFPSGVVSTKMTDYKTSNFVKIITSELTVPIGNSGSNTFEMKIYSGPNEFKRLAAFDNNLEEIIPFGSSIFGTINRWFIRPFFDFLSQYIGSKGIVIILLIFLIKMLLYPLMYKMLYSQAKMGALKPELSHLKEKYKDDMQKQQMETMKIYREYGVSPLGGCLPMLLQMPIWYALFRFFPASITFRQEPFLWASDLSSYDVLFYMGFEIPFFGAHVSLFTLLWAVSTIIYTYYNMQNVDLSANPAMKYVQYIMPVMFLAFFNNYASGLTCYMFFSNLINILQTVVTKNYIFDESKIREELLKEKAKPKKKSGFTARLEEAMKQQQAMQERKKKK